MFKNTSLQTRLFSAFLFIGSLVLIVGIIGWSGSSKLAGHIATFNDNAFPSTVSLWKVNEAQTRVNSSDKALIIASLNLSQRQQELKKIETAFKDISDGLSVYDKLDRTPEEDQIYKKFKPIWETWIAAQKEFEQLHNNFLQLGVFNPRQVQADLAIQGRVNSPEYAAAKIATNTLNVMSDDSFTKLDPAGDAASNALLELLRFNEKLADTANKNAQKDIATILFALGLCVLCSPIIAVAFAIYFSNTIAKPMGAKIAGVVGVAEKISTGDLTSRVDASAAQDEVGKLENAFRTMTQNLSALIRQVQQSGILITASATQIAASGKELEATMAEQVASTNEVAATAKEIAANSKQLLKTIDDVEHTSEVTGQAAGESQKDLLQMEKTMKNLVGSTNSISTKLGVISDKANSINTIVTTITKVADQTNLLSLNAAIEAEKAGEYGSGFAVVAREIRRLADQTAVATLDIETMVKEMQGAVSTGVMEMDKFTKEVERGVDDVRNIGGKLESIIRQVQTLTPQFDQVGKSMEGQSQGAQQISEAMVQLSESSAQTSQSLREINHAIGQLNEAAQGLRKEISHFKVGSN